jgi:predicted GNAT family N-acyltransferase
MCVTSLVRWHEAEAAIRSVREAVFVQELGIPLTLEIDGNDPECVHVLAYTEARQPIGTGRLKPSGQIGRLAVLSPWRGRGVGRALLTALLDAAQAAGHREVVLSAQLHAAGFYEKLGFTAEGDVYEEAGIPHQRMRHTLTRMSHLGA